MAKRVGLKKEKKKSYVSEFIEDIKIKKSGELLKKDEYKKAFNGFFIIRLLSMTRDNVGILNLINHYQHLPEVDNEMIYKILIDIIPKQKTFDPYIKKEKQKQDDLELISEYFQCSMREASDYKNQLGDKWVDAIKIEMCGKK